MIQHARHLERIVGIGGNSRNRRREIRRLIRAGFTLFQCKHCGHREYIKLEDDRWPRAERHKAKLDKSVCQGSGEEMERVIGTGLTLLPPS